MKNTEITVRNGHNIILNVYNSDLIMFAYLSLFFKLTKADNFRLECLSLVFDKRFVFNVFTSQSRTHLRLV